MSRSDDRQERAIAPATGSDQECGGDSRDVLVRPKRPHACNPGWELRWHEHDAGDALPLPSGWYFHDRNLPVGTVLRCDCGRVWVAEEPLRSNDPFATGYVTLGVHWRPERWRERRRRLRKERAHA